MYYYVSCTIIAVSSLNNGEYVVRFFLPDGAFPHCGHGQNFSRQLINMLEFYVIIKSIILSIIQLLLLLLLLSLH